MAPAEDGECRCKACDRTFPSSESLLQHKAYKQKGGAKDHIHCQVCGLDFKTDAAQRHHVQTKHPKELKLDCPGCGSGPFPRVSHLMEHIESGNCPQIDGPSLDAAREKKLDFTRRLAALTREPVKNDYARHFPSYRPGQESRTPAAATQPKSEASSVPSVDPHDPDKPSFRIERYYSKVISQYICPKPRCGKVYKASGGLIAHLRSNAHMDKSYRCPYCSKLFNNLTAISSHVEASSVNCRIRESDGFNAYLDQLTAGIVDAGTRDKHGTIQYTTTDTSRATFGLKKEHID